jgi:hypothetical protein
MRAGYTPGGKAFLKKTTFSIEALPSFSHLRPRQLIKFTIRHNPLVEWPDSIRQGI